MAESATDSTDARSWGRRLAGAATVGVYRTGATAARLTPGVVAQGLAVPVGWSAKLANRQRRAMFRRHLQRVIPDATPEQLRRGVQRAFDSYARYWIESLRLPMLPRRTIEAGMTVEGYDDYVVPALDAGTGVILALPHLGGWEWAGRWLADRGHRLTVVVERVDPPELFEWFRDLRSDLGMNVVALGPDAGREILTALRNNEVVCLLSDRDIGGGGVEVEFFGERTTLPGGPATIALRSGAPVLPTAVYFTDEIDGHLGIVRPPLDTERQGRLRDDVARVTQQLAFELETLIRRAPDQWHMFQPNWPSDRTG